MKKHTHKDWHDFVNEFGDKDDNINLCGYEDQLRVKKWAKNRKGVIICPVDDSYHAGSDLVLVKHPSMGITVVFIPQCTTVTNQFFLYPQHQKFIVEALIKFGQIE